MKYEIDFKSVYKSETLTKAFNNRFNNMRFKNSGNNISVKYPFNFVAG